MKIGFQDWCVLIAGIAFPLAVLAQTAGFFTGTYDRHPLLLLRGVIVSLFVLPFFFKGLRKYKELKYANTTTPTIHS